MDRLVYVYSKHDFLDCVNCWNNDKPVGEAKFDELLCNNWNLACDRGYFRYRLDKLETKILNGKYKFVAQLNIKRAVERRRPQFIASLSQAFNSDDFNFTKVGSNEILFSIRKVNNEIELEDFKQEVKARTIENGVSFCHQMIINVSPLEFGNSIFVPYVNLCRPQVLSLESITMAIELLLCSSKPSFRVGFNSLCANASVNHHHFHVYYLKYELPVETVGVENIANNCYEIINYPASGFAFQLINRDIHLLAESVFRVTNYFQCNNIAHNLFITRGTKFNSSDDIYDTVRVFVWARNSEFGIKDDTAFNIACCELAGHLPVKKFESFQTICEEQVVEALSQACNAAFNQVLPKVKSLFI